MSAFLTFIGAIVLGLLIFAAVLWVFTLPVWKKRQAPPWLSGLMAAISPVMIYFYVASPYYEGWVQALSVTAWAWAGLVNGHAAWQRWRAHQRRGEST